MVSLQYMRRTLTYIFLMVFGLALQPGAVAQNLKGTLQDTLVLNSSVVSASSAHQRLRDVQIGIEKIGITEMARMPAFMGEKDVIKALQFLPGVKEASQGSSGFQVRGGTTSQNLILLDGAPVYNAGHMMGMFSTFNDDALMDATLYKGLVPASYGGASSSVLDVTTRPGDMSSDRRISSGTASIGLLSTKASVGGPIKDGKASFYLSARRTYFDLFLKLTEKYKNTVMSFYDLNARFDWSLSPKDRLAFSAFSAKDHMSIDDLATMRWGNRSATLRWSHTYSPEFRSNVYAYVSSYDSDNDVDILEQTLNYKGFINQQGLSAKWIWKPSSSVSIDFGVQPTLYNICTGEWAYNGFPLTERRRALDAAGWVAGEWTVGSVTVLSGFRLDMFSSLGGSPYYEIDDKGNITRTLEFGKWELVKPRAVLEPRLSINWSIDDNTSIKTGYSRSSQNIHALKNDGMSLPFDRYIVSSNLIRPQIADQVSLGLVRAFKGGDYDISLEGYYKAIQNVIDYKEGKYLSSEIELERIVKSGEGKAYGLETTFRKNVGRMTGWLSYTLSWSLNKIDGVNNGEWYVSANDRRHDVSVVGMYDIGSGWNATATWVYATGQAMSAPSAKYKVNGNTWYYYSEKNGYRAPANHHLDISATHTKKKSFGERQWVISAYNVYSRKNPYVVMFMDDDTKPSGTKAVMTSIFGIVPSVSYIITF